MSYGHTFVPSLFWFEFSLAEIETEREREIFTRNMTGQMRSLSAKEYQKAFEPFGPGHTNAKIA